jgi:hypothetical protein
MSLPETGADESFSHPDPAVLYANGVRILAVYSGGSDPAKAVSKAYWDACIAQGIAMVLVDEHGNQQMLTGGPGFGTFIARECVAYARMLGLDPTKERPLYYVGDDPYPLPPSQWGPVVDRFREICAEHLAEGWVLPGDTVGSSLVAEYGSGPLSEHLYDLGLVGHITAGTRGNDHDYGWLWPVSTWGPCPHAAMFQDPNTRLSTLGGAIDRDYLAPGVNDVGQYPAPDTGGIVGAQEVQQVQQSIAAAVAQLTTGKADFVDFAMLDAGGTSIDCRYVTAVHGFYWIRTLAEDNAVADEAHASRVVHSGPQPVAKGATGSPDAGLPIGFGRPLDKVTADHLGVAYP